MQASIRGERGSFGSLATEVRHSLASLRNAFSPPYKIKNFIRSYIHWILTAQIFSELLWFYFAEDNSAGIVLMQWEYTFLCLLASFTSRLDSHLSGNSVFCIWYSHRDYVLFLAWRFLQYLHVVTSPIHKGSICDNTYSKAVDNDFRVEVRQGLPSITVTLQRIQYIDDVIKRNGKIKY